MRLIDIAFNNMIDKDDIVMLRICRNHIIADKWKYFADSDYLHAEIDLIPGPDQHKFLITLRK